MKRSFRGFTARRRYAKAQYSPFSSGVCQSSDQWYIR